MKRILAALLGLLLCASLASADTLFPNAPTTGQIYNFNNTGVLYQWDGAKWVTIGTSSPAITKQVFTASGTYTPSSGMQYAIIECVGSGGGGGGVALSSVYGQGGGGGGGSYSRTYVTAAQVGTSQTVTVGAAGTGGTAGANNGTSGSDVSVGTLCVGKGGSFGGGAVANSNGLGGAGGVAGTGDVTLPGGTGQTGSNSTTAANTVAAAGGDAGGGFGTGGRNVSFITTGAAGNNYGGGGSGGGSGSSSAAAAGGNGAKGIVVITEHLASSWGGPLPQVVNPQGRLTLTTATPVTTSDVTAATTVYYTPYKGGYAPLYNGTQFTPVYFNELSLVLGANWATNSNYDVFLANNAGVLDICTGPAWTSDTARGTGAGTTELEQKQGIYVNKNSLTCRTDNATTITVAVDQGTYLGTFRTVAAGQTEDSLSKRFVWNMYNRTNRAMSRVESTATWTYSTATVRQANGSTANQLSMVRGLDEEGVFASVQAMMSQATAATFVQTGIGLDSTTAPGTTGSLMEIHINITTSDEQTITANYGGYPGLGYHYLSWLERGGGAGTTTWYGNASGTTFYSGIRGTVMQ